MPAHDGRTEKKHSAASGPQPKKGAELPIADWRAGWPSFSKNRQSSIVNRQFETQRARKHLTMAGSRDGHPIVESAKRSSEAPESKRTEIGSGYGERTHKDKAFIFSQIGRLRQERTHSEYRLCYQLIAAISRPISGNFEWMPSSDCRLRGIATVERESDPER